MKLQTTVFHRFILLAVPGSLDRPQGQVLQKLPQTMNYYDILWTMVSNSWTHPGPRALVVLLHPQVCDYQWADGYGTHGTDVAFYIPTGSVVLACYSLPSCPACFFWRSALMKRNWTIPWASCPPVGGPSGQGLAKNRRKNKKIWDRITISCLCNIL